MTSKGAHHIVGFVLKDVAVVKVFSGEALELDDDAGYGARGALDGIFPAHLVGSGRLRLSLKQHLLGLEVLEDIERAAIEDLEADEVQMHGVRCLQFGCLGDGLVPALAVDEHQHGALVVVLIVMKGQRTGCCGLRLGNTLDGAQGLGDRRNGHRSDSLFGDAELQDVECARAEVEGLSCELAEVDEDVCAFGATEDKTLYFDRRAEEALIAADLD